jgi:hypothetical protein
MSTNNWKTPKSAKFLEWEALMEKRTAEVCARYPHLDDATKAEKVLAAPEMMALTEEVDEELRTHAIEEAVDKSCFVYGRERRIVSDEVLRRMSDRELAAWAQANGVMFAQLGAHLAERFPSDTLQSRRKLP